MGEMVVGVGLLAAAYVIYQHLERQKTDKLMASVPQSQGKAANIFIERDLEKLQYFLADLDKDARKNAMMMVVLLTLSVYSKFGMSWVALLSWVAGMIFLAGAIVVSQLYMKKTERLEKVQKMMPPLLMHMSCNALMTAEIERILEHAMTFASEPLTTYFQRMLDMMTMGETAQHAILQVNEEVDCPPFNDCCLVLLCYADYGGNLSESLLVLRERLAHQAKVSEVIQEKTKTALAIGIVLHFVTAALVIHGSVVFKDRYGKITASPEEHAVIFIGIGLVVVYWVISAVVMTVLRRL